jgi:hypothetical protein
MSAVCVRVSGPRPALRLRVARPERAPPRPARGHGDGADYAAAAGSGGGGSGPGSRRGAVWETGLSRSPQLDSLGPAAGGSVRSMRSESDPAESPMASRISRPAARASPAPVEPCPARGQPPPRQHGDSHECRGEPGPSLGAGRIGACCSRHTRGRRPVHCASSVHFSYPSAPRRPRQQDPHAAPGRGFPRAVRTLGRIGSALDVGLWGRTGGGAPGPARPGRPAHEPLLPLRPGCVTVTVPERTPWPTPAAGQPARAAGPGRYGNVLRNRRLLERLQ